MKLIPHHQGDRHGRREYRSPDGTWRAAPAATGTNGPAGSFTNAPRPVPRGIATPPSSARRNALVFLDTTTVTPAGESPAAATATSKRRETSQPRKPRKRITHDIAPVHADTRGIKR